MNHLHQRLSIIAAAVTALAACGPGTAAATPTPEPRDAVVQALRSTAELDTVHALLRIELRDSGGQEYLVTIEGDVDVATRELDVRAVIDPEVSGIEEARLVVVDGSVYSKAGDDAWSMSGGTGQDPLESVPTTARIAAAVEAALRDPATTIALEGSEACGAATCFKIRAEITAEVAWRAVTEMFSTEGRPADLTMPATFPGFAIDLWIEQDTLRIRQATNTTAVEGQSISITVALSRHDEPVSIVAPVVP